MVYTELLYGKINYDAHKKGEGHHVFGMVRFSSAFFLSYFGLVLCNDAKNLPASKAVGLGLGHLIYKSPQVFNKTGYESIFGHSHGKIDMPKPEEICEIEDGAKKCYRETGRELWVEPLKRATYSKYGCNWIGICHYLVLTEANAKKSIPFDAITEAYNRTQPPQTCYNKKDIVFGVTARLSEAWYSTLALHIHYELTDANGVKNVTEVLPIRLPAGNCDLVNVYKPIFFDQMISFLWFGSLRE